MTPRRGMPRALLLLLLWGAATGAAYEWGGAAGRGERALRAKRYEEALRALREGRKDHPQSAAVRFDEGLALAGGGHPDSAAVTYKEAMGLKGSLARAAAGYNSGNLAMRGRRFGDAATLYREALRLRPGDEDAKRNLEEAIRRLRGTPPSAQPQPQPQGKGNRPPQPQGNGNQSPQSRPDSLSHTGEPKVGSESFSREEAERWLEALESQRRASRKQEQRSKPPETRARDW